MSELIKFTPGERPAHIGPDELVRCRYKDADWWLNTKPARECQWIDGYEYHLLDPLRNAADDQLEAQCKARGWTVTKPLVTQAERDRLADAFEAFGYSYAADDVRNGREDELARAFIDTYEGAGQ